MYSWVKYPTFNNSCERLAWENEQVEDREIDEMEIVFNSVFED